MMGEPLPDDLPAHAESTEPAGDVALRVIASHPSTAGMYRLDQLIAALAHERLWLTDAYFVGLPPYVSALINAAGYCGPEEVEILSRDDWWTRPGEEIVRTVIERFNTVC